MRLRHHVLLICLSLLSGLSLAGPVAPDEAGARAAEESWSRAFVTGDTATLDTLLDADYVSVNAIGSARAKAEVLQLAAAYAKAHPGATSQPLSPTSVVRVNGNMALVTHSSPADVSVDVLYFRDGRWHAWYSQHTSKAAPKA
jgi:aryl-alcohol dehydrogenase-like predicted oxidoreductase